MTDQIIVTGCARCGTSLTMQMLAAGGVEVTGEYPSFEIVRPPTPEDFARHAGQAIKALDIHEFGAPAGNDVRFILCLRNPAHQAQSIAKFTHATMGAQWTASMMLNLRNSIKPDVQAIKKVIGSRPVLKVKFEDMILKPATTAHKIAEFVGISESKIPDMIRQVWPREVRCYPGLLELELMREGDGADQLQSTQNA